MSTFVLPLRGDCQPIVGSRPLEFHTTGQARPLGASVLPTILEFARLGMDKPLASSPWRAMHVSTLYSDRGLHPPRQYVLVDVTYDTHRRRTWIDPLEILMTDKFQTVSLPPHHRKERKRRIRFIIIWARLYTKRRNKPRRAAGNRGRSCTEPTPLPGPSRHSQSAAVAAAVAASADTTLISWKRGLRCSCYKLFFFG